MPLSYEQFRLGMSFKDVRRELAAEAQAVAASGDMMFVTRRTVLGRMRQYKQAAYLHYLKAYEETDGEPI